VHPNKDGELNHAWRNSDNSSAGLVPRIGVGRLGDAASRGFKSGSFRAEVQMISAFIGRMPARLELQRLTSSTSSSSPVLPSTALPTRRIVARAAHRLVARVLHQTVAFVHQGHGWEASIASRNRRRATQFLVPASRSSSTRAMPESIELIAEEARRRI
jgi:hypothetical protein